MALLNQPLEVGGRGRDGQRAYNVGATCRHTASGREVITFFVLVIAEGFTKHHQGPDEGRQNGEPE